MAGSRREADLEAQNTELRAENALLRERVAALTAEVEELKRRLGQSSRNSSKPPSSDPPMSRQERRALARERAKESLRKAGGQPGHEGKHRQMAPPERVDETFEHLPERCSGCGHGFEGSERQVGEPVIHQKWELPPIRPLIHEHRLARLRCPGCGKPQLAELPKGVSASAFGPQLEAHIATLAGVFRLSRRQVAQVVREVFGIEISMGAVDATIMRMSAALADPWRALREAAQGAGRHPVRRGQPLDQAGLLGARDLPPAGALGDRLPGRGGEYRPPWPPGALARSTVEPAHALRSGAPP